MPIINKSLEIEQELYSLIEQGKYTLEGSVVRDKKGKIVRMLSEISEQTRCKEKTGNNAEKLVQTLITHKKIVVTVATLSLMVTGTATFRKISREKLLKQFHQKLGMYLEAENDISSELLLAEEIIAILNELDKNKIQITLSPLEFIQLLRKGSYPIENTNNQDIEENYNELIRNNIVQHRNTIIASA